MVSRESRVVSQNRERQRPGSLQYSDSRLVFMKEVKIYWMENCSTCQKAVRWLDRRGIKVSNFRDIKEKPLNRAEVERLVKMLGEADELFSKRAVKYRELKLSEKVLSREEMLELMSGEYTFLKRPILEINGHATAGFFEKSYLSFLEKYYYPKK